MKKWKLVLNIFIIVILAILLIPVLILASPVLLVIHFKSKKKQKPECTKFEETIKRNSIKTFSMPYITPQNPLPDDVFVERIADFICLQYYSVNDYTGGTQMRELVASDHPENKAHVLEFLQSHPISELLCGERYACLRDVNHWYLRFIFEDPALNRSISGYGWTELTEPYLLELVHYLPRILTKEEQYKEALQIEYVKREMESYLNKEIQKNDC